jgi:hypothetical protein
MRSGVIRLQLTYLISRSRTVRYHRENTVAGAIDRISITERVKWRVRVNVR